MPHLTPMPSSQEKILREFREKFVEIHQTFLGGNHLYWNNDDDMTLILEIESFLSHALSTRKTKLKEAVEELPPEVYDDTNNSIGIKRDAVLQLIEEIL